MTTTPLTRTLEGTDVPAAGAYEIDPSHTEAGFVVRHLGLAKVRGRFAVTSGTIRVADDLASSSVDVTLDAASIDTSDASRDEHLRGADFLDVEQFPEVRFRSTGVTRGPNGWLVEGELTVRGVTRPVTLTTDYEGAATDPWGNGRIAFSASTEIDREDFGLTWNQALETGGVLVGKRVRIELEVQAVKAD